MSTAVALVGAGACIGIGIIFGNYIAGISRQPKLDSMLFTKALISMAFVEGMFFVTIVLSLLLGA
jgi:F-type H+-transporting ATPase subunit c